MRILLVSQLYPGRDDPTSACSSGSSSRRSPRAATRSSAPSSTVAAAARRYLALARDTVRRRAASGPTWSTPTSSFRPGLIAAFAGRARSSSRRTARTSATSATSRAWAATRAVVRRAAAVVAVSDYLRRELEVKVPDARGKTHVIDCGVDLDRFRPIVAARRATAFLCVGSLRRARTSSAWRARSSDSARALTFLGDGPLRRARGQARCRPRRPRPLRGRPGWIERARVVCQPSLVEPFGQAVLESMACGRPVVATKIGGPPEFVPDEAGVLVDPIDEDALAAALAEAPRGCPARTRPRARGRAARRQGVRPSGWRRPRASRSRSASLISTSGRTGPRAPFSRASASACS